MPTAAFAERRRARISQMYRDLRALDADLYERCVQSAATIALNHAHRAGMTNDQRTSLAADIEASMVEVALAAKESR